MSLREQLEPFASSGREAFGIVQRVFDGIVTALRRDPRFVDIKQQEFDLLLADARNDTERELFDQLRGRICLDDIGDEVEL